MSDEVLPVEAAEALLIDRWKCIDLKLVGEPLDTLIERTEIAVAEQSAMQWGVVVRRKPDGMSLETAQVLLYPWRVREQYEHSVDIFLYSRPQCTGLLIKTTLAVYHDITRLTYATLVSSNNRPIMELPPL